MCVIFHIQPNAMPHKDKFYNSVMNNWHSWGIVLKSADSIEMVKAVPESGENDPEYLYKLLEDNKDKERFLHIRHTTKGATDALNAQPFEVYSKDDKKIFFMHNGTLNGFGQYNNTGASDTREFCEKVLSPSLACWNGPQGPADYTDMNYFKLVVDKQWTAASTGLFVSNMYDTITIGNGWTDMPESQGVRVSNTLYFDRLSRGPEYDRREAKKKEEQAKNRQESFRSDGWSYGRGYDDGYSDNYNGPYGYRSSVVDVTTYDEKVLFKSEEVLRQMARFHADPKWDSGEGICSLTGVTFDEWVSYVKEESEFSTAFTLEHIVKKYSELHEASLRMATKIERMQKQFNKIMPKEVKNAEHPVAA